MKTATLPPSSFTGRGRSRRPTPAVLAGLFLGALAAECHAQCPEAWIPGFGVQGTNDSAYTLLRLSSGDLLVGGRFSIISNLYNTQRIARLSPNGMSWSALGTGIGAPSVSALAELPGGDVVAGGLFATAGGVAASSIARYSFATNAWSALGAGVAGIPQPFVGALLLLPSGDLIVGGHFTTAGNVSASCVARYNPTTGAWSRLGVGMGANVSYESVRCLALLPGGDLIVGGFFQFAGGLAVNSIARYSFETSSWSPVGAGVSGSTVSSIVVLPGGDLVVGGGFSSSGTVAVQNIARVNPDTGVWSPLGPGIDGNGGVLSLARHSDGSVIIGGNFTIAGGIPASNIARYDPTTGVWSALGSGVNYPATAFVELPSRDIAMVGGFTTAGGLPAMHIARYTFGSTPACYANCDCSTVAPVVNASDFICFMNKFVAGDPYTNCDGSSTPPILNVNDFICYLALMARTCP